jgi:hypothetical protein
MPIGKNEDVLSEAGGVPGVWLEPKMRKIKSCQNVRHSQGSPWMTGLRLIDHPNDIPPYLRRYFSKLFLHSAKVRHPPMVKTNPASPGG